MKPFIVSFFSSICFLLLQACSSSPVQQHTVVSPAKIALPDYLEQYIGQDVSSIRRELNLRKLGYETLGAPIQTPNQLSYTIARRIQIPTPMPTMRSDSSVGAIPIPTHTPFYDVQLECQVHFLLKDNIAQSIQYRGKACKGY